MNITLTEIKDQYRSLEKTIALVKQRSEALASFYKEVSPRAIVFTGCGSSYMLSCSMRSIASVRADIPVYALASGDLWLNSENYRPMLRDALIVSLSRSGCTSEVVNAYETVAAMNVGAKFMSLTCAEDTPLEKLSDFTLAMPWNFDQSVCQTRCVSNLYAAGAMAVGEMMGDKAVVEGFEALAADGDAYLERIEPQLRQIAANNWTHGVVLADGPFDGLAEEGALAFKEISQLPSNYYHLLDVRHGPIVLFNPQTLVIVRLSDGARKEETALVRDILKKGAQVLTATNEPFEMEGTVNFAFGRKLSDIAAGLPLVNLCQMATFFKSGIVGCDPDAPDGLDPWIKL